MPASGDPLPQGQAQRLSGGQASLPEDFKGQLAVMLFWQKDCRSCQEEMPEAEKFYQANKDKGFTIVAINIANTPDEVRQAISSMGITYPVLVDQKGSLMEPYGIRATPTVIVLGRDGRIKERILGGIPAGVLEDILKSL